MMIGQEKVYETLKALGIEFDYLNILRHLRSRLPANIGKIWTVHIVRICFSGIIRETGITWLFFIVIGIWRFMIWNNY